MNKFMSLLVGTCVLLSLFSSSVAGVENPKVMEGEAGKYGGTLVWSVFGSGPKTFNLPISQETSSSVPLSFLFDGLTEENRVTTEIEPSLAESWEFSQDGLVWTFYLRKGVTWFDGESFTADDVVFTYNDIIYNEDIATGMRDLLTIEGKRIKVEKVDNYTVRFTLPVLYAPLLRHVGTAILPKHILETSVKKGTYMTTWGVDTPPERLIGTGPYMMTQYIPADRIIYKRNPHYWKVDQEGNPLPYLDGMIILIVPNQDTELLKFQAGEVDVYGMRGADYATLKPGEKEGNYTVIKGGPTLGSSFVILNWSHPDPVKFKWFNNLQFRKAVAHAIDRQTFIDNVMYGFGQPQWGPVSVAVKTFHNPEVKKYPYELAKARKILQEAGFTLKAEKGESPIPEKIGPWQRWVLVLISILVLCFLAVWTAIRRKWRIMIIWIVLIGAMAIGNYYVSIRPVGPKYLYDSEGHKVEFELWTISGNSEWTALGTLIADDLAKLGMGVHFRPLDFNLLVQKLTTKPRGQWDAIIIGLTGGVEPHGGANVWKTDGGLHSWNYDPENRYEWELKLDELFNKGVQELDPKKRKLIYDQWQLIVSENLPFLYTASSIYLTTVRNTIKNIRLPAYGGLLWNMEQIYLEK